MSVVEKTFIQELYSNQLKNFLLNFLLMSFICQKMQQNQTIHKIEKTANAKNCTKSINDNFYTTDLILNQMSKCVLQVSLSMYSVHVLFLSSSPCSRQITHLDVYFTPRGDHRAHLTRFAQELACKRSSRIQTKDSRFGQRAQFCMGAVLHGRTFARA